MQAGKAGRGTVSMLLNTGTLLDSKPAARERIAKSARGGERRGTKCFDPIRQRARQIAVAVDQQAALAHPAQVHGLARYIGVGRQVAARAGDGAGVAQQLRGGFDQHRNRGGSRRRHAAQQQGVEPTVAAADRDLVGHGRKAELVGREQDAEGRVQVDGGGGAAGQVDLAVGGYDAGLSLVDIAGVESLGLQGSLGGIFEIVDEGCRSSGHSGFG